MYLNKLQQDKVLVQVPCETLWELTQMKPRKGLENTIVSNGKSYEHIPINFSSKRQSKCSLMRIIPNYIGTGMFPVENSTKLSGI